MALRIGKKKTTDAPPVDTSPVTGDVSTTAGVPISNAPDDFSDFSNIPTDAGSNSTPLGDALMGDAPLNDAVASATQSKKKAPPKALLGALGALLLIGLAAGAYTMLRPSEPVDDGPLPMPTKNPATSPPPKTGAPVTTPKTTLNKPPAAKVAPKAAIKPKPTPIVIVHKIIMPGIAPSPPLTLAKPGVQADPNAIKVVPPPGIIPGNVMRPSLRPADSPNYARLKALWNEGATAKHRLNYAAARRAWQQGLKLASTSPKTARSAQGFRDALAKLPK